MAELGTGVELTNLSHMAGGGEDDENKKKRGILRFFFCALKENIFKLLNTNGKKKHGQVQVHGEKKYVSLL